MKLIKIIIINLLIICLMIDQSSCFRKNEKLSIKLDFNETYSLLRIMMQNLSNEPLYVPLNMQLIYYADIYFKDEQGEFVKFGDNLYQTLVSISEKSGYDILSCTLIKDSLNILKVNHLNYSQIDSIFFKSFNSVKQENYPFNGTLTYQEFLSKYHNYYLKPQMMIYEKLSFGPILSSLRQGYPEYDLNKITLSYNVNVQKIIKSNHIYFPDKFLEFRLFKGTLKSNNINMGL